MRGDSLTIIHWIKPTKNWATRWLGATKEPDSSLEWQRRYWLTTRGFCMRVYDGREK